MEVLGLGLGQGRGKLEETHVLPWGMLERRESGIVFLGLRLLWLDQLLALVFYHLEGGEIVDLLVFGIGQLQV